MMIAMMMRRLLLFLVPAAKAHSLLERNTTAYLLIWNILLLL